VDLEEDLAHDVLDLLAPRPEPPCDSRHQALVPHHQVPEGRLLPAEDALDEPDIFGRPILHQGSSQGMKREFPPAGSRIHRREPGRPGRALVYSRDSAWTPFPGGSMSGAARPAGTKPRNVAIAGTDLAIAGADGHESSLPLGRLRSECPCATCRARTESDRSAGPLRVLAPEPAR